MTNYSHLANAARPINTSSAVNESELRQLDSGGRFSASRTRYMVSRDLLFYLCSHILKPNCFSSPSPDPSLIHSQTRSSTHPSSPNTQETSIQPAAHTTTLFAIPPPDPPAQTKLLHARSAPAPAAQKTPNQLHLHRPSIRAKNSIRKTSANPPPLPEPYAQELRRTLHPCQNSRKCLQLFQISHFCNPDSTYRTGPTHAFLRCCSNDKPYSHCYKSSLLAVSLNFSEAQAVKRNFRPRGYHDTSKQSFPDSCGRRRHPY